MTKIRLLLMVGWTCLTVQACVPAATQDSQGTPTSNLESTGPAQAAAATLQPTHITPTALPSSTFIPTVQPSFDATIQPTRTPYPTYSPRTQPTSHPQSPQICRDPDPSYSPRFDPTVDKGPEALTQWIIASLNSGATYRQVVAAIPTEVSNYRTPLVRDLTGDQVDELLVQARADTLIVGCLDGQYRLLDDEAANGPAPSLVSSRDMNRNGIPDLVFDAYTTSGPITFVNIVEWDGSSFVPLIQACHGDNATQSSALARQLYWYQTDWLPRESGKCFPYPFVEGEASIEVRDTDGNGTLELVVTDHGPLSFDTLHSFGPWRGKTTVFEWDGLHFLYSSLTIDRPVYRFQALQDADREFLLGNYDQALSLYQDVIFSDKLQWWTPERIRYPIDVREAEAFDNPAPAPPEPDPAEYKALAAYTRYRIVLSHLARGWTSPARTVLQGLHTAFTGDPIGAPYVQAGDLLWTSFQETKDLASACGGVVEYFDQHPELLKPLGDSSHGQQSHIYAPEDTCPIR